MGMMKWRGLSNIKCKKCLSLFKSLTQWALKISALNPTWNASPQRALSPYLREETLLGEHWAGCSWPLIFKLELTSHCSCGKAIVKPRLPTCWGSFLLEAQRNSHTHLWCYPYLSPKRGPESQQLSLRVLGLLPRTLWPPLPSRSPDYLLISYSF